MEGEAHRFLVILLSRVPFYAGCWLGSRHPRGRQDRDAAELMAKFIQEALKKPI